MNRFATLVDALTALPVGPEAIADHLAAAGIVAHCNEPGSCAIAEYLTAAVDIPAGHVVRVSNLAASIRKPVRHGARPEALERAWFNVAMSVGDASLERPDITVFVDNFDRGQYPDLIAGTPETVAA